MAELRTALVAAEDAALAGAAGRVLRARGWAIEVVADGAAAEARLAGGLPDLLVVQLLLPGGSGLLLARRAKAASDGRVPVVMVAADLSPARRDLALAEGVDAIVPAPADLPAALDRLCPRPLVRIGRPAAARLTH